MDRRGDPGECSGDYVFYIEQSVYRVVPESVQIRVCRVLTVRKTDRKERQKHTHGSREDG